MPARYRMDETGRMRRTWNGKLPEEFTEKDMLLFAIDTDILVNGRVSVETQNAVREAGYRYESGNLLPLETRKEDTMENQKNTLEVSVKVYPLQEKGGNLLAFASATVGGCFAVNGIRVMDSEKGKFVAMPSSKGKDGKYHDICCPTTAEMRQVINTAVLGEYQKAVEKPSLRGALQNAAKEAAARPAPDVQRSADKGAR
jgi:stage V sporulation protein G